jgi:hypothetical protein
VAGLCFGSTGGLDGAAEASFGSCKEGDTVVTGVRSGGTGGMSDVAEGTLRSCRRWRSVVLGMCSGGTGGLCGTAEESCRGGFVAAGVCSGDAGGLRDATEGSLRACSSERTFPLSTRGGWGDSERASLNCAWDSYESMPLGGCIRLDGISANAGAGRDDDSDMEALGRSKGGEGVEGSAGGWTEAVRLIGSGWGLVAFLSLDEKDGG